jgi:hypothetical protein
MRLRTKAKKLARMLNDDTSLKPSDALAKLGFGEGDFYSEDDSIIDDGANELIDLGWEDDESVVLRREYRARDRSKVWDVRVSRYLTNHREDSEEVAA